jgi:MoxR-like ATPase
LIQLTITDEQLLDKLGFRRASACCAKSGRPIIGQDEVRRTGLLALSSVVTRSSPACPAWQRHCSCERLPTSSISRSKRIQFTPDLMPADITGTEIIEEDSRHRSSPDAVYSGSNLRQHRAR